MSTIGFTEAILLIKCTFLHETNQRYLVFAVPPSTPPLTAATKSTIGFTEGILLLKCKFFHEIKQRLHVLIAHFTTASLETKKNHIEMETLFYVQLL